MTWARTSNHLIVFFIATAWALRMGFFSKR